VIPLAPWTKTGCFFAASQPAILMPPPCPGRLEV
jgi:hypothetical protein